MQTAAQAQRDFDVVVVGGGSAGIGVTASLLRRRPDLRIAVIEPSDKHYYQPAWTLVGGGAFDVAKTVRPTRAVMPGRATWLPLRRGKLAGKNTTTLCGLLSGSYTRGTVRGAPTQATTPVGYL